jgi:hypothetical protein
MLHKKNLQFTAAGFSVYKFINEFKPDISEK